MGKSSNKSQSDPKVDAAGPPSNSTKEGKREAEDELENQASAKKQKMDEVAENQKNKEEISSDDSTSDSEEDKKPEAKVAVPSEKQPAKNGTLSTPKKKGKPVTSSSSSESSDDGSNENEAPKSEEAAPEGNNGPAATKKKVQSSQSSPDACSESDCDRSSDEDNGEMDIDEGDSSEESDEEAQKKEMKVLPNAASNAQKPDLKAVEEDTSSDSSDDDDEDDDDDDDDDDSSEDSEKPHVVKKPVKDSESSEDSEEEIEEKASKTPLESAKDVEMDDAASIGKKAPTTPAILKEPNAASKTIYVRNLSYSVERDDMENLFKECGEIVDVRLHTDNEGRFRGFGHVEFATAEAAQKALELDNTELLRRPIRVGIAQEKGEYSPNSRNLSYSFHKRGSFQSQTVFVKGFDRSLTVEKIKAILEEHFNSCGEITRISIPKYHDSGAVKGFAHLDFKDFDSLKKALQLHETELGGYPLSVEKAKPRRDNQGTGSGRGGGGH